MHRRYATHQRLCYTGSCSGGENQAGLAPYHIKRLQNRAQGDGFVRVSGRAASIAVAAGFLCVAMPASAISQNGRFVMKDSGGDLLRLDTRTGAVSYCRKRDKNWICQAAADDRAALHDEIARLQRENERLAAQNAELERRLKAAQREPELPNEQELDRVFEFMERLMRRFHAFAQSIRDSMGRNT